MCCVSHNIIGIGKKVGVGWGQVKTCGNYVKSKLEWVEFLRINLTQWIYYRVNLSLSIYFFLHCIVLVFGTTSMSWWGAAICWRGLFECVFPSLQFDEQQTTIIKCCWVWVFTNSSTLIVIVGSSHSTRHAHPPTQTALPLSPQCRTLSHFIFHPIDRVYIYSVNK